MRPITETEKITFENVRSLLLDREIDPDRFFFIYQCLDRDFQIYEQKSEGDIRAIVNLFSEDREEIRESIKDLDCKINWANSWLEEMHLQRNLFEENLKSQKFPPN